VAETKEHFPSKIFFFVFNIKNFLKKILIKKIFNKKYL